MRIWILTIAAILVPALAHAHVGHLAGLAGHDHWVAGAAVGTAIAIAAWTAVKGRDRGQEKPETDGGEEQAETPEGQKA